jgi:RHS repeat-associated protein
MDSAASVIATNTFTTRGLVSRRVSTVSVLYAFDSEGNLAQRTNATGVVVSDHLFDAHGVSLNGTLTEPFGYKGQFGYYTDNETGLQLLSHRYYDPSTGRFLTRDPISYVGGINLYTYVQNNPSNLVDPLGLVWWTPPSWYGRRSSGAGAAGPVMIAGTVAVMDGPEPGPADVIAVAYLIWACFGATASPMAPAIPLPRPTPKTLVPPLPLAPKKEEGCDQEWQRAFEICADLISKGRNRGITGGYTDLYSCARGLVSERCGGNKVSY